MYCYMFYYTREGIFMYVLKKIAEKTENIIKVVERCLNIKLKDKFFVKQITFGKHL